MTMSIEDPLLIISKLKELLEESRTIKLSLVEKSAIFSAARFLVADLEPHVENTDKLEHLGRVSYGINAILGYEKLYINFDQEHGRVQNALITLGGFFNKDESE